MNNAGVFLDKGKPEATRDDLMNTFEINSVAPIMLTRVSRYLCGYWKLWAISFHQQLFISMFAGINSVTEKGVRIQ